MQPISSSSRPHAGSSLGGPPRRTLQRSKNPRPAQTPPRCSAPPWAARPPPPRLTGGCPGGLLHCVSRLGGAGDRARSVALDGAASRLASRFREHRRMGGRGRQRVLRASRRAPDHRPGRARGCRGRCATLARARPRCRSAFARPVCVVVTVHWHRRGAGRGDRALRGARRVVPDGATAIPLGDPIGETPTGLRHTAHSSPATSSSEVTAIEGEREWPARVSARLVPPEPSRNAGGTAAWGLRSALDRLALRGRQSASS